MRPIHLVQLDKLRPAVLLTRSVAVGKLRYVTVAPITSTIRGIAVEVPVGTAHGLDHDSVINCDNVQTIAVHLLGRRIGYLRDVDDFLLIRAIREAFDLP